MPISTNDHRAAYLQRRAVLHETLCRVAATIVCNPLSTTAVHPCQLRKCRRDGVCQGALRPSARLQDRIVMMQQVGWTSTSSATLPLCMISADDQVFEMFEGCKNSWAQTLADNPKLQWAELARGLKARLRGKSGPVAAPPSDAADAR